MKVIFISTLCAALSGCTFGTVTHSGEHFAMSGTPEGLRAYGDYMIGTAKTAKEEPKARNQYLTMRSSNESHYTARALHKPKSFIEKLLANDDQDVSKDETGDRAIEEQK